MTATENAQRPLSTGDFVEVAYTASLSSGGRIIDTTDPEVATEADIADLTANGPVVVVLGAGHLFDPVERAILDAGVRGSDTVTVTPEDAFGDVDPRAKATVELDHLPVEQREMGEQVQYKGETGFIESLDEATATVNFNHPLAGSTIHYEFSVHRRVDDPVEQARGLVSLYGAADASELTLQEGENGRVIEWSVRDPFELDDWVTVKRGAIEDLHQHLDIDEVRVTEHHPRGGSHGND